MIISALITKMSTPPWSNYTPDEPLNDDQEAINPYRPTSAPTEEEQQESNPGLVGGAAIAGGVLGTILAGPFIGIAAALGLGALATQKNQAGDVARASGEVVVNAGEAAKKFGEEHHLVEKTKMAANATAQKAQEIDREHHIVENTKRTLANVGESLRRFDQEHRVVEKTTKSIAGACHFVADKLKASNDRSNTGSNSEY